VRIRPGDGIVRRCEITCPERYRLSPRSAAQTT